MAARSPIKLDQPTLRLLVIQWLLFGGSFALYFFAAMPPGETRGFLESAAGFPVLVDMGMRFLAIHIAFTIWHEAAHGNVSNRKWVNNVVGVLGMVPYGTPYFLQRHVHLLHHKYLNVPVQDPNLIYADGPFWQLPIRYARTIGFAKQMLREDPRTRSMKISDYSVMAAIAAVHVVALFQGVLLEVLLLWAVPLVFAKIVMDWYVNYLPHVGLPADRFLGTRIIDEGWLSLTLLQHNYHAIHHLWPSIPWHRYKDTFDDRREYLVDHGVPIEPSLFAPRLRPEPPAPPAETADARSPDA